MHPAMNKKKSGIGLLGGTFDPVHNGHISISSSFLDSGYLKELWILLTPDPPHKLHREFTDFHTRFDMLKAAFRDYPNVRISDLEKNLPKPSYTVQTLSHLVNKNSGEKFYLCMGEDSLAGFKGWYKWRNILSYCKLLVAERPSGHAKIDPIIEEHALFIPHEPIEISSTEIRKRIKAGNEISRYVPRDVEDIIRKRNLYK